MSQYLVSDYSFVENVLKMKEFEQKHCSFVKFQFQNYYLITLGRCPFLGNCVPLTSNFLVTLPCPVSKSNSRTRPPSPGHVVLQICLLPYLILLYTSWICKTWKNMHFSQGILKAESSLFLTPALRLWGGGYIDRHIWRWVVVPSDLAWSAHITVTVWFKSTRGRRLILNEIAWRT